MSEAIIPSENEHRADSTAAFMAAAGISIIAIDLGEGGIARTFTENTISEAQDASTAAEPHAEINDLAAVGEGLFLGLMVGAAVFKKHKQSRATRGEAQ